MKYQTLSFLKSVPGGFHNQQISHGGTPFFQQECSGAEMKLGSFDVGLCPIVGTKHGTSFRIGPKFLGIQQEDFKKGK
ncbi:MAG TPA: hypothetical protein VNS62_03575, partial [Candidatus Udaeobacter sp.]|nr:hypothetical protein [Candidatus Udaeobacter sp.]